MEEIRVAVWLALSLQVHKPLDEEEIEKSWWVVKEIYMPEWNLESSLLDPMVLGLVLS
jgi:hypothetical protein